MRYLYFLVALCAAVALSACEGKKSLDGYPMDKPPPSAFMERDSVPEELDVPKEEAGSDSSSSQENN